MLICSSGLISASSVNDPGSRADETKFTMWIELYDSNQMAALEESAPPGDIEPLDPLKLNVDQEIQLVVRYSGLHNMDSSGIQNLGFSFDYNANYLELMGFEQPDLDTGVGEWYSEVSDEMVRWIPEELQAYWSNASVRTTEEEGIYRVYLQYIADGMQNADGMRDIVLREENAIVGVFTFKVSAPISESGNVKFVWSDYLMSLYGPDETDTMVYTNYSKARFADNENFEPPEDLQIATTDAVEPDGWTISGSVMSYNAKNPITYELYRMGAGGEYETEAAYTGTAVEAVTSGETGGRRTQEFTITGVANGTYMLVLSKISHLDLNIKNVVVNSGDLDLASYHPLFSMGEGDLNGDGLINANDGNIITRVANYNKGVDDAGVTDKYADLDGNALINANDGNIITATRNYNKKTSDFDVTLSYFSES